MSKHNTYLNLITSYQSNSELLFSEEETIKYLNRVINDGYNNSSNYDIVNYELLIYLYITFQNNEFIQDQLNIIFNKICNNYEYKTKLLKQL